MFSPPLNKELLRRNLSKFYNRLILHVFNYTSFKKRDFVKNKIILKTLILNNKIRGAMRILLVRNCEPCKLLKIAVGNLSSKSTRYLK